MVISQTRIDMLKINIVSDVSLLITFFCTNLLIERNIFYEISLPDMIPDMNESSHPAHRIHDLVTHTLFGWCHFPALVYKLISSALMMMFTLIPSVFKYCEWHYLLCHIPNGHENGHDWVFSLPFHWTWSASGKKADIYKREVQDITNRNRVKFEASDAEWLHWFYKICPYP